MYSPRRGASQLAVAWQALLLQVCASTRLLVLQLPAVPAAQLLLLVLLPIQLLLVLLLLLLVPLLAVV